jgi:hypothetical protein
VARSGSAALDAETLALLQRAAVPPPPELAGSELTVPLRFSDAEGALQIYPRDRNRPARLNFSEHYQILENTPADIVAAISIAKLGEHSRAASASSWSSSQVERPVSAVQLNAWPESQRAHARPLRKSSIAKDTARSKARRLQILLLESGGTFDRGHDRRWQPRGLVNLM